MNTSTILSGLNKYKKVSCRDGKMNGLCNCPLHNYLEDTNGNLDKDFINFIVKEGVNYTKLTPELLIEIIYKYNPQKFVDSNSLSILHTNDVNLAHNLGISM